MQRLFKKTLNKAPSVPWSRPIVASTSPAETYFPVRQLQQSLGNRAIQRLVKSGAIQTKLRVGKPNDQFEQEADQVADQVMRMQEPQPQRQRQCPI